jgi:cell division protein FtsI/penicillin-binding protein 2
MYNHRSLNLFLGKQGGQSMNVELQRARRRQMVVFVLVCGGMLLLLGRLYYWQVLNSSRLSQLATDEHTKDLPLKAPRGLIFDAQGHLLATNIVRDDVYIEPRQFRIDFEHDDNAHDKWISLIQTLHQVLPYISEDNLINAYNSDAWTLRVNNQPIDPAQSEQLQAMYSRLPDVFLQARTLRSYPGGDLAAQVLGYVDSNAMGEYGIEGKYNTLLAGKDGSITAETDLNGHPLTVGASSGQAPVPGANLTLTIDSTMQYVVQTALVNEIKKLQAQSGSVVVLNARTGAVVAMAGAPSFDPNNYGNYASQMGCVNSVSVYFNPTLYCTYEPGSTMKAVTMAAGLDQGLITPNTAIYDPGYIRFNDAQTVTNWNYQGYGMETMTQVLDHSANVGAAYVAHDKLKSTGFYPYVQRFGFGKPYNIDGPESAGTYRTNTSIGWSPSDLTRQAFGQSISTTPFQMAMVYEAIANGGVMMQPTLVQSINNNGQVTTTHPQVRRRVISANAAKQLTGMLVNAANYNQQATFPGYSVAVKTGTATTQGISDMQTEASMAGFLPASNPQFVILVKIDRPSATIAGGTAIFGGTAAAPLWKTIAEQLMWHYNVPPDLPIGD